MSKENIDGRKNLHQFIVIFGIVNERIFLNSDFR